jgi:hypothetical protein
VDDLKIVAIDKENNSLVAPIPADKWVEWWESLVLPALLENEFNNNLMIKYPVVG